jgi:hypothetical protein
LQYYQDRINADQQPFEDKFVELNDQMASIQKDFPDEITDVLNGISALEIVKREDEAMQIEMATRLLNSAIDRVAAESEKVRSPGEKHLSYILGSYKSCLELKRKVLMMNADGGPSLPLITDAFKAQRAALFELLKDCPTELVQDLADELDAVERIESMESLVA